jgi:stress-induced-phosphoprotein 1
VEDHDETAPKAKSASQPPTSTQAAAKEPAEETEEDVAKNKALALKAEGTEAYKKREFDVAVEKFKSAWETWQGDVTFLTNLAGGLWMGFVAYWF